MAEIAVENGQISNFEGVERLVTLTMDRGITVYRHASLIDFYIQAKFH